MILAGMSISCAPAYNDGARPASQEARRRRVRDVETAKTSEVWSRASDIWTAGNLAGRDQKQRPCSGATARALRCRGECRTHLEDGGDRLAPCLQDSSSLRWGLPDRCRVSPAAH